MHYCVYLDEFGHIGLYISHTHPKHNDHPVFGLAGIAIPVSEIRAFSTYFYQLKGRLLQFEIAKHKAKGLPEYEWEKKGASLFTLSNVQKYPELRKATFRLLKHINTIGGFVFYVGQEKHKDLNTHCPKKAYAAAISEALKRLNDEFSESGSTFQLFLDEHTERLEIFRNVSRNMFGEKRIYTLIEPPFEVDSKLYQTIQCADWICGLVGRIAYYQADQAAKPDWEIFQKYFNDRLTTAQKRSSIRYFKKASTEKLSALMTKFR
ncbi:DUF3800 domain-containing protein [Rheinheimera muenzenbergensis]|uniref:DUF3800 domain-containing protein n=1 Tax=Rheinheimera muenzenbergensis TaxID=1193628 RepID=A0ABU8CBT1_9GAMM